MGKIAQTLRNASGPEAVEGFIPEELVKNDKVAYTEKRRPPGMSEHPFGRITVVKDVNTRKEEMLAAVLAGGPGSGFIALPGGYGMLNELLEATTWVRLKKHDKAVCAFNVKGFYGGIVTWINHAADAGFIQPSAKNIIVTANTAKGALKVLKDHKSPEVTKSTK
jgi:uncharacterized protein (TIGR00730 family)